MKMEIIAVGSGYVYPIDCRVFICAGNASYTSDAAYPDYIEWWIGKYL
jgi:hypothetical protein